ncbi:hypothetical protein [Microbacterium sp. MPKO10]|uniref:hypothetical protein n=1 Tax=Microbacterium sp. MPKO10 TaxID=2989818 RepID=UPI0022358D57|nr:hypothetical protein [Microbacterium sp. MPKO10]MCW4457782.1 hypothetical protein [Microbacterium sp. MPKO10]
MNSIPRSSLIALAAVFSAYHIARGMLTIGVPEHPAPVLVALVLYAAATLLTLWSFRGRGMPVWAGAFAFSSAVVVTLLVTSQLDPTADNGYATWHTNAVGTLMTIIMVRGRKLMAAAGTVFLVIYSVAWCGIMGSAQTGVTGAVAWVILAYVMTGALRKAEAGADQLMEAEREAMRWEAAQHAHRSERRERLETASRIAGPMLRDVVLAGGRLTDSERDQARLLEARLRDDIRGRALVNERVRDAVLSARRRGIAVQLLDEGTIDGLDAGEKHRVLTTLAAAIDEAETERLIVRTAPEHSDAAVTIVGVSSPPPGSETDDDDVDVWMQIPRREGG